MRTQKDFKRGDILRLCEKGQTVYYKIKEAEDSEILFYWTEDFKKWYGPNYAFISAEIFQK